MPEAEKQYVNVLFDRKALEEIDEFRYRNRFPSRTEAIRWLIEYALKQRPKKEKP